MPINFTKKNVDRTSRIKGEENTKVIIRYVNNGLGYTGRDGKPGKSGENAINIYLDKNNMLFESNNGTAVSGQSDSFHIIAYNGKTRIDTSIGEIGGQIYVEDVPALTATVYGSGTTDASVKIDITNQLTQKSGVVTVPVYVNLMDPRDDEGEKVPDYWDSSVYDITNVNLTYSWALINSGSPQDVSIYTVDLSNEFASINCDASGNILPGAVMPTCTASLTLNGEQLVDASFGLTLPSEQHVQGITINSGSGVITFDASTLAWDGNALKITVRGYHEGVLRDTADMNLLKNIPGAPGIPAISYWLSIDADKVKVDPNNGNIATPSTVSATAWRQEGGNTPEQVSTSNIKYAYNTTEASTTYAGPITIDVNKEYLYFALKIDGTQWDQETVPILWEGRNGNDGDGYRLDLTNENASINCDASGNILPTAHRPSCTAKFFFGITQLISGVTYSIDSFSCTAHGITIDPSTGVLTFSTGTDLSFVDDSLEITVKATYNTVSRTSIMTLTKSMPGQQGEQGEQGFTPYIQNGYWYINGISTGIKAEGQDGSAGLTPEIGENGNWWIGGSDTGVLARGTNGVSITGVTEYYACTSTNIAPDLSTYVTSIPADYGINKKYLWNYEEVRYSSGTPTRTTPSIVGVFGKDGKGITSITEYYAINNSTTPPAWSAFTSTTVQIPTDDKPYLWNYEYLRWNDGTDSSTNRVIIGIKGAPGGAGCSMIVSNDNASVACDASGRILTRPTCSAQLYLGTVPITSGVVWTNTKSESTGWSGITDSTSSGKYTLTFGSSWAMPNDSGYIKMTATYDGNTYEGVMNITKVYPSEKGADAVIYWITPSVNACHVKNGTVTPSTITVSVSKQVGANAPTTATSSDGTLYFRNNGGGWTTMTIGGSKTIYSNYEYVDFKFAKNSTANPYDLETIPVIRDGVDGLNGSDGAPGRDGADGTDGLSIVWKGDLTSAPSNPQTNWCFRYTGTTSGSFIYGYVYIYNGFAWSIMNHDGSDGEDGAQGEPGADGNSVFITYHDNPQNSTPATPTGTGTTGGWHTNATRSVNWMSQKLSQSASTGTWGFPIKITGKDGRDGSTGAPGEPGAPGADAVSYWLELSNDEVYVDVNNGNTCSPATISARAWKQVGGQSPIELGNSYIKYGYDGTYGTIQYTGPITVDSRYSRLNITLDVNNVHRDNETVLLLKSGRNGSDGTPGRDGSDGSDGLNGAIVRGPIDYDAMQLVDYLKVPILHDNDGYSLVLSNCYQQVGCGLDGKLISDTYSRILCQAYTYNGKTAVTSGVNYSLSASDPNVLNYVTINSSTGLLTFSSAFNFTGNSVKLYITAAVSGKTMTETFKIVKVFPEGNEQPKTYYTTSTRYAVTASGQTVGITVTRRTGTSASTWTSDILAYYDFDTETPSTRTTGTSITVSGTNYTDKKYIYFAVYKTWRDRRWCNGVVTDPNYPDDGKYIDVIVHGEQIYTCNTSYTDSSLNWNDVSTNWTPTDKYDVVATKLMLADNAKINFLSNNELYLLDNADNITAGAKGGSGINFWAGDDNPSTAPFKVEYDGTLTATKANITGTVHATDGDFTGTVHATNGEFNGTVNANQGQIGGFNISGSGLSNGPDFDNDAYIIFRNDYHSVFAGMGGNILPSSSGLRAVARFENEDKNGWWGSHNYAVLLSAKNGYENTALHIDGGAIEGLNLKNKVFSSSGTLDRYTNNVICINTSAITITLPTLQPWDSGHVIRFKRLGEGSVTINTSYCYTWNGYPSTRYSRSCVRYNKDSFSASSVTLPSDFDSFDLVWVPEIITTYNNIQYYSTWLQYKLPRDW